MKAVAAVLAALVALGVLFYVYTAPTAPPEMTTAEIAQIQAEVDLVSEDFWATWSAAEDFDRFMTFYADDPEVLWINDAEPFFGRAEIDAAFRPAYENMQRQDNTPIEWRTIVIAPDVVFTVRINDVAQTDIDGNPGLAARFAETAVWVKRDGEWKVLTGHGSSPNESM